MNTKILNTANHLDRKISDLKKSLNCFEWKPYCDEERKDVCVNLNPQIIIEFDGDGREQQPIPMALNEELIRILKKAIEMELAKVTDEFELL